ncbi:MAG: LapA family protein [Desulfohalobiaceae bacterium]|nr:LapA family protein [Desulfohalobiaceae bacterium]
MNSVYLILTFILVLILALLGVQNTETLSISFLFWELELTISFVILYSALLGAAAVGILALPKLANKHFSLKRARKELNKLRDSR